MTGDGIQQSRKNEAQLIKDNHKLGIKISDLLDQNDRSNKERARLEKRNKDLLNQNGTLETEKADIVKVYNELHEACHVSAGEFKTMKNKIEWLEEDKVKYEKACKQYATIGKMMCGIVLGIVVLFLTGIIVMGSK